MSEQPKQEEPYPVHETVKVLKGKTIYKNKKWWYAVLLTEEFGHKKVKVYMWSWNDKKNGWTRKQHIGINFRKNWEDMKVIIEEYMKEIEN